jgi:hypothetical protein
VLEILAGYGYQKCLQFGAIEFCRQIDNNIGRENVREAGCIVEISSFEWHLFDSDVARFTLAWLWRGCIDEDDEIDLTGVLARGTAKKVDV